ncbi:hypothetical protein D3C76_1094650 [compost metagenome]
MGIFGIAKEHGVKVILEPFCLPGRAHLIHHQFRPMFPAKLLVKGFAERHGRPVAGNTETVVADHDLFLVFKGGKALFETLFGNPTPGADQI